MSDAAFTANIPAIYERYLVPFLFEEYAEDMARRVAALRPARVLELAAGTGVLTRAMARLLPASTTIVATDLNSAMLEQAAARGTSRPVEWREANAMTLPFEDESFDVVVCQFGVMFFPDKPAAFAESRRVLRAGGTLLFNVWGRMAENDIARIVEDAMAERYPNDAPRFLSRAPYAYNDPQRLTQDLAGGGFTSGVTIEPIARRSRTASAHDAAVAFVQGCPLRNEIESRDANGLNAATDFAADAIARRFGTGAVDAAMSATIVSATR